MEVLPTHCLAPKVRLKIRENDCATRHTKQQKKPRSRTTFISIFVIYCVWASTDHRACHLRIFFHFMGLCMWGYWEELRHVNVESVTSTLWTVTIFFPFTWNSI